LTTFQTQTNSPNTVHDSGVNTESYSDPQTLLNKLTEVEIQQAIRKKSSTAEKLALNTPQPHRGQMVKLLKIGLYVQQRFEIFQQRPKQDINSAIAIFLYGIWSINNQGRRIPEGALSQLIASTQERLKVCGNFLEKNKKSPQEKRLSHYETFAMIGVWLLMIQHHLATQPNDTALENIKIMAQEILTYRLKIEPQSIDIDQDGRLHADPIAQQTGYESRTLS
jgi:hypothetical protein